MQRLKFHKEECIPFGVAAVIVTHKGNATTNILGRFLLTLIWNLVSAETTLPQFPVFQR
jgi:hypothetical protein